MLSYGGRNLPLPSFSSVLTLYAHGEPPTALLQRADAALVHAKQRGRAQAVVALHRPAERLRPSAGADHEAETAPAPPARAATLLYYPARHHRLSGAQQQYEKPVE